MYSVFLNQNQRNFEASGKKITKGILLKFIEYQKQAKNLREKYHEWEEKLENIILNDYDLNFWRKKVFILWIFRFVRWKFKKCFRFFYN